MWMMLQASKPSDFVLATGEAHTVQEFVELAFDHARLDWKEYVQIDNRYFRPTEIDVLLGDASKAGKELGWHPRVRFHELVKRMVDADIQMLDARLSGDLERQASAATD
jgi:GDPmannose 4,6-dehydratase